MDDFDHADLDGDGEFDAIDMEILEDGEKSGGPPGSGSGCMVLLVFAASLVVGGGYGILEFLLT